MSGKYRVFVEPEDVITTDETGHKYVWIVSPDGTVHAFNVQTRRVKRSAFGLEMFTNNRFVREV